VSRLRASAIGAYLSLSAGYLDDLSILTTVPVIHLAVICLGVPATGALAGSLFAGPEPPSLARQPIQ
jgi:hypothetical protein